MNYEETYRNFDEEYRNFDEEYKKLYAAAQTGMTQEALKLALEALEKNTKHLPADFDYHFEAITAIKEALAQTQEPWCMKMNGCKTKCEDCPDKSAQPEQEPVAWLEPEWGEEICPEVGFEATTTSDHPRDLCWIPLYPHPPQRTWVGLTDEEENEYNYLGPDMHWVIQEIAAKLKEKNT